MTGCESGFWVMRFRGVLDEPILFCECQKLSLFHVGGSGSLPGSELRTFGTV